MIPADAVDHYDRGAVDAPLIVLIHGTLDRAASFHRTVRRLDTFDVVAYDRRGYDRSLSVGATADLSRHVADALRIADGRRCVMIGHSFGGLVALGAAEASPSTVVAVGAYETPAPWLVAIDDPPGWDQRDEPWAAAETFFVANVGAAAWRRLGDGFRAARQAEGPAMVADLAMAKQGPAFELADVLQPVSYACGTAGGDRYRVSGTALMAQVAHGMLTRIPGPQHGAHLSHPDAFANWIITVAEHR